MHRSRKPVFVGLLGALGLSAIYVGILSVAESFQHAVSQFVSMWPWISLLVVGFGTQLGLYVHMRVQLKARNKKATAEVAATGGVSAAAMIACCAHHLVDLLPILGFSAAAVFLTEYQIPFIVLGIVSNLTGVFVMLYLMQKHGLHPPSKFFAWLLRVNFVRAGAAAATASALAVASAFLFVGTRANADEGSPAVLELSSVFMDENSVSFEVTPMDFQYGQPLVFEIRMNTHQVDLGFDLMNLATVTTDEGAILVPVAWEGSAPGGHHRDGKLIFPEITLPVGQMSLVVEDVAEVPKRIFTWKLN